MVFTNRRPLDIVALQAATTINDTDTVLDGEIDVRDWDRLIIFLKYTKGSEDGLVVTPKNLIATGGDEYPQMEWSTDAAQLRSAKTFELTVTANAYIILDVSGTAFVKIYQKKKGGTVSGTLKADYTLLRQGIEG